MQELRFGAGEKGMVSVDDFGSRERSYLPSLNKQQRFVKRSCRILTLIANNATTTQRSLSSLRPSGMKQLTQIFPFRPWQEQKRTR